MSTSDANGGVDERTVGETECSAKYNGCPITLAHSQAASNDEPAKQGTKCPEPNQCSVRARGIQAMLDEAGT